MAERLFTWVTPIPCPAVPDVRTALADISANPAANGWLPFGSLPMLHFASLTLFVENDGDRTATLIFESNVDSSFYQPVDTYVRELVRVGRQGLDRIYGACDGYPDPGAPAAKVVGFLACHEKRAHLYHVGHPDRSVQAIRGDYELRRSIDHELRDNADLWDRSPVDIVALIRLKAHCPSPFLPMRRPWHPTWNDPPTAAPTPLDQIQWRPDQWGFQRLLRGAGLTAIGVLLEVALVVMFNLLTVPQRVTLAVASVVVAGLVYKSAEDTRVLRAVLSAFGVALLADGACRLLQCLLLHWSGDLSRPPMWLIVAAGVVLTPAAIIALSYLNIILRLKVTRPLPSLDAGQRRRIHDLMNAEDCAKNSIYNHVAGLSMLKDDFRFLRAVRTWLALRFLNLFYRTYFVRGKLASIRTIQFAQWTLVDSRRLLFLTNYDGGADSYLDDFFDSLAVGVAFIWFDTVLFPATSDPRLLKIWVRQGQTLASVRYRASIYQGLTVGVINNNTYIRTRLIRGRGQSSARRWLRRFSTTPVEPTVLARFTRWLKELAGVAE